MQDWETGSMDEIKKGMARKEPVDSSSALLACYPSFREEVKPLLRFYQADDLPELIREMESHIVRLQERVEYFTDSRSMLKVPREG